MTDAELVANVKRWTENDYGLPPRIAKDLVALAMGLEAKLAEAERERDEALQRAETAESVQASMTLAAEHAQDALAAAEADVRIYRKAAQDNIASRNAAEAKLAEAERERDIESRLRREAQHAEAAAESREKALREASADDLRALGWTVAIHNDYRQDGATRTFWLLTHPSGRWSKGEGATDAGALAQIRAALAAGKEKKS